MTAIYQKQQGVRGKRKAEIKEKMSPAPPSEDADTGEQMSRPAKIRLWAKITRVRGQRITAHLQKNAYLQAEGVSVVLDASPLRLCRGAPARSRCCAS